MAALLLVIAALNIKTAIADEQNLLSPQASGPQIFFDAADTYLNREGSIQVFEGGVVAIAAGTLISADKIALNRQNQTLVATGHVLLLSASQVFLGETMTYHLDTDEFTLSQALMVTNDPKAKDEIIREVLGFTSKEFAFKAAQKQKLAEITQAKEELRKLYRNSMRKSAEERDEIVERYTLLLEKEKLITAQDSPHFSHLSQEKRQSYKRRRRYWQESQASALKSSMRDIGYFAIEGDVITRLEENQFMASNAFATPCLCEEDEKPAWGFRSEKIFAQSEGYASLTNPVLEIKGIPVLYLPYLKVPLKSKRQSGFLLPNVTHSSSNGNLISQPVYFAFSQESDATLTTDFIEKRGFRLGLEYRLQTKKYSGWEFNLEGIRDREWLARKAERETMIRMYQQGLTDAKRAYEGSSSSPILSNNELSDPDWWRRNGLEFCLLQDVHYSNCASYDIENRLAAPSNSWRGKFKWSGQTIIAPRLSVVSQGLMLSDHRYLEDLYIPSYESPFSISTPPLFADAKFKLHLDAKNFYAGLGASFGDHILTPRRYSGYQLPLNFKLQSRLIPLARRLTPVPIYGQLALEHRRIELYHPPGFDRTLPENTRQQRLGDGTWQRAQVTLISPLIVEQIFQTNHFTEFEYRRVEASELQAIDHRLSEQAQAIATDYHSFRNYLHTLRTGLHFTLPLDGRMELSPVEDPEDGGKIRRFLEHRMNWEMIFSLRPYVHRRGGYGEAYHLLKYDENLARWSPAQGAKRLTYFVSDNKEYTDDDIVPEEHRMYPHQKIIFKTFHDWLITKKKWQLIQGQIKPESSDQTPDSLEERARKELFYSLDRPIAGFEEMFDERGRWFVNRYHLNDIDRLHPLHFAAEISYDYIKEKQRQQQKAENANLLTPAPLAEPWSPITSNLSLGWQDWKLGINSKYNLYQKVTTEMSSGLTSPSFFATSLGFYYKVEKESIPRPDGGFNTTQTRTRTYALRSQLIPHTTLGFEYGIRTNYQRLPSQEYSALTSFDYLSPSNCWGLRFLWHKKFEDITWDGTYYLALVVKFLNYTRDYGNLTSRFNEE